MSKIVVHLFYFLTTHDRIVHLLILSLMSRIACKYRLPNTSYLTDLFLNFYIALYLRELCYGRSPLLGAFDSHIEPMSRLEFTKVMRFMKREGKKWRPCAGTSSCQTTQIPPFFFVYQYSNPSFPYLTYPTIFGKFFTFAKKISRSADHRCIFFFLIFVCIKRYPSSDSVHFKENVMKIVPNSRR